MALKGQIVEQVLKIVNGGQLNDDSKITKQEVGALLEQERDALVRKTILENATLGEHELPNEFISVHRCQIYVDHLYGGGGRPYVYLPHQPVNLPNDGGIYRVCKITDVYEGTNTTSGYDVRRDKLDILIASDDSETHNLGADSEYQIKFQNKKAGGHHDIGNKFVFSLLFGQTEANAKKYSFQFTYKNQSGRGSDETTLHNLNANALLSSLNINKDFQQFLNTNRLRMTWAQDEIATENFPTISLHFHSTYTDFYMGPTLSTMPSEWAIKSVLTNSEVVDFLDGGAGDGAQGVGTRKVSTLTEATDTAGIYPARGFGITIEYSKNSRLKELGDDIHGVKSKGSTVLHTYIELTHEDMIALNFGDVGYGVPTVQNLAKMWVNKYASILKIYGIRAYINPASGSGAEISIEEETPLGGFDDVRFQPQGTISGAISADDFGGQHMHKSSERLNYRELYCYSRMPNPGMYSRMYDDAILLSGKKFWYRQDSLTGPDRFHQSDNPGPFSDTGDHGRAKLYLYNENPRDVVANTNMEYSDPNRYPMHINVWMVAKSGVYEMNEEFPVPEDALSEIIKSLVATFTTMRAAKEDVVNDNIDIV